MEDLLVVPSGRDRCALKPARKPTRKIKELAQLQCSIRLISKAVCTANHESGVRRPDAAAASIARRPTSRLL